MNILQTIAKSILIVIVFASSHARVLAVEEGSNITDGSPNISVIDATTPYWWVSDLITVLAVLVGAAMIVYQLGRQHRNELALQKENYREQLRLKVYQEFSRKVRATENQSIQASMYGVLLPRALELFRDQTNSGLNPKPIVYRAQDFARKHQAFNDSVIRLMFLFEKYQIINPDMAEVFKLALGSVQHDIEGAFMLLHPHLLQILPMEMAADQDDRQVVNVIIPTDEQIRKLKELLDAYSKPHYDLMGYLSDLKVELQNVLLSSLFDNKLAKRKPLDPNVKIITCDPKEVKKLKSYFEKESDWGKKSQKVKAG